MAEQMVVNLGFNADTSQVKRSMQDLQNQLSQLIKSPVGIGEKLTTDIQSATQAAAELKIHLQNATNVKTGALDFGKFNASLKQSGITLSEYAAKLQSLGPQGQQAFMSLANAIAASEVPVKRVNAALTGMMSTLKNTAKWQISSSILHGFMGAIQNAYNYAQDLNESLNNIRIVTSQNIEQMSRFAEQANRAAKALSTTTTEYTNASLIYYQQGLSDNEVLARANTTIKMANVTRQSAEVVSDQMTAVWNNFDNGTKTLEYYADVMTALGAATASSTDEIAQGLEKFAAVAETVGLSYEYATSALATVTATTRQSADVVGTAFKTLFARIQDLDLGETLDDGTTLGSYSEALMSVGINIKENNGELKNMDDILEEMGQKWKMIDKDQQVALAKSVAGIRQYTQLIALMDNWDFMQENLDTAYNSTGTLNEQAEIYAESWEAAQKRVQASAEEIYAALFNDEFFIDLTNAVSGLLDIIGDITKSIGGLGGVLSGLALILTRVFKDQIAQGFRDMAYTLQAKSAVGQKMIQQQKLNQMNEMKSMMALSEASTQAEMKIKNVYSEELQLQTELIANAKTMTQEEHKKYQLLLDQHKAIGMQTVELTKQLEVLKDESNSLLSTTLGQGMINTGKDYQTMFDSVTSLKDTASGLVNLNSSLDSISGKSKASSKSVEKMQKALMEAGMTDLSHLDNDFLEIKKHGEKAEASITRLRTEVAMMAEQNIKKALSDLGFEEGTPEYERARESLEKYYSTQQKIVQQGKKIEVSNKNQKESFKSLIAAIQSGGKEAFKDWANHLSNFTSSLMSAGMLISSVKGLMDTIKDPDASGWERFGSILTSVSMIGMSLAGVLSGVKSAFALVKSATNAETLAKIANIAASYLQEKASRKVAEAKREEALATDANGDEIRDENIEKTENIALNFVDKHNNKRTFTGKKDKNENLIDSTGKLIAKDDYSKLPGFENYSPAGKEQLPVEGGSLLNPGTLSTLLGVAGSIAAIAAALALVAGAITIAVNQYQEAEKTAAAAEEQSKKLAEAYQDAKGAYEEFKSTTDSYQDAVEGMKEMTKGTLEYNEALIRANESAMNLIDKYSELANHYTIDNGLILIDENALAEVQQKELDRLGKVQASQSISNITSRDFKNQSDRANLARDMNTGTDFIALGGNSAAMAGVGAGAAALVTVALALAGTIAMPGVGTAIGIAIGGAIAGAVAGGIATGLSGVDSKAEIEAIDKIVEHYSKAENKGMFADDKEFKRVLTEELKISEQLAEALVQNRDAVKELVDIEMQRLAQDQADWNAAYAAANMGNSDYTNHENQEFLNNMGFQTAHDQAAIDQVSEEVNNLFTGSNDDFWKAYLTEVLGEDASNLSKNGTEGENYRVTDLGGGNVTLQRKNEEGTWETIGEENSLSEEVAAKNLENARLLNKASNNMSEDIALYNDLFIQLKNAGINSEQANSILNGWSSTTGTIDLNPVTIEQLGDLSSITNKELKESLETSIRLYKDGLSDLENSVLESDWYKNLSFEDKTLLWENVSVDQASNLEAVQEAFNYAQHYLNTNTLSYKFGKTGELIDLIQNNNGTEADWSKIETLFKETYKSESSQEWYKFLQLSQAEQISYLQGKAQDLASVGYGNTTLITEQAQNQYNQNKTAYDQAVFKTKAWTSDAWGLYLDNKVLEENEVVQAGADYFLPRIAETLGYSEDGEARFENLAGYLQDPQFVEMLNAWVNEEVPETQIGIPNTNPYLEYFFTSDVMGNYVPKDMNTVAQEVFENKDPVTTEYEKMDSAIQQVTQTSDALGISQQSYEEAMLAQKEVESVMHNTLEALGSSLEEFKIIREGLSETIEIKGLNKNEPEDLKKYNDLLDKAAQNQIKIKSGIQDLSKNWDKFNKVMLNSNSSLSDYADVLPEIKQGLSKILDVGISDLTDEFVKDNWSVVQDVYNGVDGAIEDLEGRLAQANLEAIIKLKGDLPAEAEIAYNNAWNLLNNMPDMEIGMTLDQTGMTAAFQALLDSGAITATELTKILSSAKFEPEITWEPVQITDSDVTRIVSEGGYLGPDGKWVPISSNVETTSFVGSTMKIPVINGTTTKYEGGGSYVPQISTSPKTGGGGGGSSKPKKAEKKKDTDLVDRYKEIEDQLDDINKAQDRASKSADRLYGKRRAKELEKVIALMDKNIKKLKEEEALAKNYLKIDQTELNKVASEYGFTLSYDTEFNVTNQNEIFKKLQDEYNAMVDKANADGNADENEQELLDKIQEKIDKFTEALEQFEETREKIEDIQDQILDEIYAKQDERLQALNDELQEFLDLEDNVLRRLELDFEDFEDDVYNAAEAVALLFGLIGSEVDKNTKVGILNQNYEVITDSWYKAYNLYNQTDKDGNSLLGLDNFIQKTKETRNAIYDEIASLQELDDFMLNYYGETLQKSMEEISKYTSKMDDLSGVLEHFNNILVLTGKKNDFEFMGTVLDGQAKVAADKVTASEKTLKMLEGQLVEAQKKLSTAVTEEEKELYQKEYDAIYDALAEAREQHLSDTEAWIEAEKAVLENSLNKMRRDLEKTLTGQKSFDWMSTALERMNSLQEEYLTTTNKIYETNKLMNKAQQEIDKTTNNVAKRRIKSFVEETKTLQDKKALSQFELDIQQAKYDLLLAEIALEEAQNAKSVVRLQRNSEGNFGYVYTADNSAIADAQQKLEDTQNNLYNISLEGANKYTEQHQQIMIEMYDTLTELEQQYLDGSFTSQEEYRKAVEEAQAYYYSKLEQASELYNIAIEADSFAAAEHLLGNSNLVANGTLGDFDKIAKKWQEVTKENMIPETESWRDTINGYVGDVQEKFVDWESYCKKMREKVSGEFKDIETAVGNIVIESNNLTEALTKEGGVVDALGKEFTAVGEVTGAYAAYRDRIKELVKNYKEFLGILDKSQEDEQKKEEKTKPTSQPKTETTTNTSQTTTTTSTISQDRINEGFNKIMRGEWGTGWDNRKRNALAAGFTEEEFELIKKMVNDYFSGRSNGYKPSSQSKSKSKTQLELDLKEQQELDRKKWANKMQHFDTGGYTGNWDGPYGKLAMVHKKELILKEGDTANFLASMEVLERILSIIDLQSANAQYIGAINSPALKSTGQDTLEQNVHIEANFPNATNRNEIEEAFKDIVNLASQYANRK